MGFGKSSPSLNEMAAVCGIPGKLGISGKEVAQLWMEGRLLEIVAYNECDALTTYLIWLRIAFLAVFLVRFNMKKNRNVSVIYSALKELFRAKNIFWNFLKLGK